MEFILILVWYLIGFICMNWIKHYMEKNGLLLGRQEVYVLAILGPFIAMLILYFVVSDRLER